MAFTGGSSSTAGPSAAPNIRRVQLEREGELRIETTVNTPLRLILLNGTAEIFGTELTPQKWITFPPCLKFAVFSWHAATIDMDGPTETEYTAKETPMISYVNVHAVLESRRNRARSSESFPGPRVIVVGPADSGKSSLCKMLVSWAAKLGGKPTFVELDVSQGSITAPGCIAAAPIESPIDPVEGFSPELIQNVDLYTRLVTELSQMMEKQVTRNADSKSSGMVINTMGWIEGPGYGLILHAIEAFSANVVLVLGQDKLFNSLKSMCKNKPYPVDVENLQKSGGVVSRNSRIRQRAWGSQMREYFYGIGNELAPRSNTANFYSLYVYQIGGPQCPTSALPVNAKRMANPLRIIPLPNYRDMLHVVLAVSYAQEPQQILTRGKRSVLYIQLWCLI